MNGFYISVSNGLLTADHRERVGSSIWEFMWCLDKITKIDDKGIGWVLSGKPIKLLDIGGQLGVSEDTVSRNLSRLEEEGYLTLIRTPYGLSIRVQKAKKRFYKNAVSEDQRNRKNIESITFDINAVSLRKNAVSNKTVSVDSNRIDIDATHLAIVEIFDAFKSINPTSYPNWFKNKTQRKSVENLLKVKGKEKLLEVIKLLPKTNAKEFLPTITSPHDLQEKWSKLEAGLLKLKGKSAGEQREVIT